MSNTTKLVDAEKLLAEIFEPSSRPSLRWLRYQQKRKSIPFYRIGRLIRFDVNEVRETLLNELRVEAGS